MKSQITGVYRLVFSDGAMYVGASKDIRHRMRCHRTRFNTGASYPVYEHWRKYGEPTLEIIEECPLHVLKSREAHWHRKLGPGLSTRWTGSGMPPGNSMPASGKAKISVSNKKAWKGQTARKKRQAKLYRDLWKDPDYKIKALQARKGNAPYIPTAVV